MERWNLHKRIAFSIILFMGSKPDKVIFGFMVASAFLSMWMSNTATAVLILPIGLAFISKMEESFGNEVTQPVTVTLLLAIAYGCSIGGVATLVGTPTNLAFVEIYSNLFPGEKEFTFGQWFQIGLPFSIISLIVSWFLLLKVVFPVKGSFMLDKEIVRNELKNMGKIQYEEKVVIAIGTITVLLWIFRNDLVLGNFIVPGWVHLWKGFENFNDTTIAIFMSLMLFIIPVSKMSNGVAILEGDSIKKLPWNAILLFGGGFALSYGFSESG
ncbi:MAG: SLC13 family permease [Bacteroidales bacterium]|nr:SLC13 family permease [Bacteroidales bacterium]